MKKVIVLVVLCLLGAGGYVHYRNWLSQSNEIKAQIERLSKGEEKRFRLKYDKIELAGYPFRHEALLINPCFYFLNVDLQDRLSASSLCLKGPMTLSYNLHGKDRSLFIETDGEAVITAPSHGDDEQGTYALNGYLKQDYAFESDYEFRESTNFVYVLSKLQKATLSARRLTFKGPEKTKAEYFDNFDGTLEYLRKTGPKDSQKVNLVFDYSTNLGNVFQSYKLPVDKIVQELDAEIKEFNKKSGVNKGHYDLTLEGPSWEAIGRTIEKAQQTNFTLEQVPKFSISITQNSKNNFFQGKGNAGLDWSHGEDGSFRFEVKDFLVQDMTKDGEKEFVALLQAFSNEVVKAFVLNGAESSKAAIKRDEMGDLFKGLPNHLEVNLDAKIQRHLKNEQEVFEMSVNPLAISTDKGGVYIAASYDKEDFKAKIDFDSLTRLVDATLTRYNLIARIVTPVHRLPFVTEKERDSLLSILQRYSDDPSRLGRKTEFTIEQTNEGIFIGKKQNIHGLLGELGFFFQRLNNKAALLEKKADADGRDD